MPSFRESWRRDKLQVFAKAGWIKLHCQPALKNPGISCLLLWWISEIQRGPLFLQLNALKEDRKGTLIALSNDLTSLLGQGHHLFILLSVFLGLLGWLGRQVTVTHKHQSKGNGLATMCSLIKLTGIIHVEQACVVYRDRQRKRTGGRCSSN